MTTSVHGDIPIDEPKGRSVRLIIAGFGALLVLLLIGGCSTPYTEEGPQDIDQRPISDAERTELLDHVTRATGTPYRWGGDTLEGMDCFGRPLITMKLLLLIGG